LNFQNDCTGFIKFPSDGASVTTYMTRLISLNIIVAG